MPGLPAVVPPHGVFRSAPRRRLARADAEEHLAAEEESLAVALAQVFDPRLDLPPRHHAGGGGARGEGAQAEVVDRLELRDADADGRDVYVLEAQLLAPRGHLPPDPAVGLEVAGVVQNLPRHVAV